MLVDNNCTIYNEQRKLSALILWEKISNEIHLVKQVSYNNLQYDQAHELLVKVDFDIINKKLVFKIYRGIGRSIFKIQIYVYY